MEYLAHWKNSNTVGFQLEEILIIQFSVAIQLKTLLLPIKYYTEQLLHKWIDVTSFSSISYCSNSKYCPQKHTQSESIHSIILDILVLKAEHQNSPFLSAKVKLDKDFTLSLASISSKTRYVPVLNRYK